MPLLQSLHGVFDKVCFIGEKSDRKVKGERQTLILSTKDLEQSVLNIILALDDQKLIAKLEVDKTAFTICDFVAKEIRYHAICRTELQNCAELKSSIKIKNDWHKTRDAHAVASEEIHRHVKECVIENDEAHFMKNLVSSYRSIPVDVGGPSFQDVVFTSQHLQEKLRLSFGDSILFDHGNKRKGDIVYNANTNLDIAVCKAFESDSKINVKSREVALDLRKSILNCD